MNGIGRFLQHGNQGRNIPTTGTLCVEHSSARPAIYTGGAVGSPRIHITSRNDSIPTFGLHGVSASGIFQGH